MNCAQANGLNLAGWLSMQVYEPHNIKGNNYWYLSPLREEKEASFKVHNNLNIWYDHGLGKGGRLVDLAIEMYHVIPVKHCKKLFLFTRKKEMKNMLWNYKTGAELIRLMQVKTPLLLSLQQNQ